MDFEWDERKNRINIRKHDFDFADAHELFNGPVLARLDMREDYGEGRWIAFGMIRGEVVAVAFTEPAPNVVRIISVRKATRRERQAYEKTLKNELGTHQE